MAVDIKVPSLGESITEGTLSRWLKKDGESVAVGDPIFELETEKITQDVTAINAGTLRIIIGEGQKVTIGAVVGRIEEGAVSNGPRVEPQPKAEAPKAASLPPAAPSTNSVAGSELVFSPAAYKLVQEANVDIAKLQGGKGGLVTKEEVLAHLEQKKTAASTTTIVAERATTVKAAAAPVVRQPGGPRESRERLSTIRQRIAQRLVDAQNTAAILTTFNEADMSAVMALRTKYKESFQKKHDVGLGFMSFFAKACVEALKAFPVVNASIDGTDVVYHHTYDISIAVSTEKGLMVPVIRDVDQLSFAQIEKTIVGLAKKARDNKISVSDLQGGTFTITNGGIFGSLLSTPILNAPQTGILGMHTIQKRPVVVNDEIVIRPMMYLALSYDHRLVDGREAVSFLVRVKECIENPERLLLDI